MSITLDLANQTGLIPQKLVSVNSAGTQSLQIDSTGVLIDNTTSSRTLAIGAGGLLINGSVVIDPLYFTAIASNPTQTELVVENTIIVQDNAIDNIINIQSSAQGTAGEIFGIDYESSTNQPFVMETTGTGGVIFQQNGNPSNTNNVLITGGSGTILASDGGSNSSFITPTSITCETLNYTTLNPPIVVTTPSLNSVLAIGNDAGGYSIVDIPSIRGGTSNVSQVNLATGSAQLTFNGTKTFQADTTGLSLTGILTDTSTATNCSVVFTKNGYIEENGSNFYYKPSTNTLTATNFAGTASTATNALNVSTTAINTNASYYLPMVSAYSSSTNQVLYTDNAGHINYNPSTNQLNTSGTITNNGLTMNGSASQFLINNNSATTPAISAPNAQLISFPSANITATTFTGNLTGTASTASTITTTSDNTSGGYYIPFSKTTAGTSTTLYLDDTTTPLTYNPSASSLTATTFNGSVANASTIACNSSGALTINGGSAGALTINSATSSQPVNLQQNGTTYSSITSNGVQETQLTTQGTATYSSPTLTLVTTGSAPYPTFYGNIITFSGSTTAQTISAITVPANMPLNGMYYVYITNSNTSAGAITVNATGLGTGIKTTYTTAVVIPISTTALGSLTKVGASAYVWSINLVA